MRSRIPFSAGRTTRVGAATAGRARRGVALAAALAVLPLTGCGDPSSRDYCTQYERLVSAVEELQTTDPATADVDEVRAAADDVTVALDQFQAVSEGRLDDAITRVRDRVNDVRQAAVAGAEAVEAARPLIEEDLTQLRSAWSAMQGFAETQCPATE
jgi:hypothetical protein